MTTRRGFIGAILSGAGALPFAGPLGMLLEAPAVGHRGGLDDIIEDVPVGQWTASHQEAVNKIFKEFYLPAIRDLMNSERILTRYIVPRSKLEGKHITVDLNWSKP